MGLFDALFGDPDYGVTAPPSRRASGGYYTCPRCGHPCTSHEAALNHCAEYTISLTNPCPTCGGKPKYYKSLMSRECPTCHGRGRAGI